MTTPTVLHWFRRDLRLQDNPALNQAVELAQQTSAKLLLVYLQDDSDERQGGAAGNWWLHNSLLALQQSLASVNQQLVVLTGDATHIIGGLLETYSITHVTWNRCYQPWQIKRDTSLKTHLKASGISVSSHNSALLWEPMQVLKKDGTPYKVFTPYYRKGCLGGVAPRQPHPLSSAITAIESQTLVAAHRQQTGATAIAALKLLPSIPWYKKFHRYWQAGEASAHQKLRQFVANSATAYKSQRDFPAVQGTSKLSPHLHFGEISPHQIWHAVQESSNGEALEHQELDCYLSEIGWREFSHYLLYHFPSLPTENFQSKFNHFPWREDSAALRAWQQGKTGFPIVDAGMRELYQTGYMHNRVRMIVGSFLVKNLLIHWHRGEAWFWECLLDADLAANTASWQWVAGSGADAAPYFRVFNPVTQGQKFDSEGAYVKSYCPELSALPKKFIHSPWLASAEVLRAAQVKLGSDYPQPIVDLADSRQRALAAFAQCKAAFEDFQV